MPSDHQLNKLIFFKDLEYSESTKKTYWGLYLNYIADLENKYEKDLGDFSQTIINEYLQLIQYKSKQTINQVNAFINKYLKWYSKYYNVAQKKFNLLVERNEESWYLNKKDFFKICNQMLNVEE
jgi:c-di-AMP phosphodiesterase-like protein